MLQLTREEKAEVIANCDHLSRLKFSPAFPYKNKRQNILNILLIFTPWKKKCNYPYNDVYYFVIPAKAGIQLERSG
jgi:hypothetical protein